MIVQVKMFWLLAVCSLLFSPLSLAAAEGSDGADSTACQPRASERHRQGQSLRCKTDPRRSLERESEPASVTG
jgi:hypothetical protein